MTWDEFFKSTPAAFNIFVETRLQMEKEEIDANNIYFGTLCAVITNLVSKKTYKANDFFGFREPKKPQTVDEMANFFKALTLSLGGKVIE